MRFGTRDSVLLFHAGMIAERLGQLEQARNELKQALPDQSALPFALRRRRTTTTQSSGYAGDIQERAINHAR